MPALIDTTVLSDIVNADKQWQGWSVDTLNRLSVTDQLVINPVIYAELSLLLNKQRALDRYLREMNIAFENLTRTALYSAAKAFRVYRKRGGGKRSPLPDCFIDAQAEDESWMLVRRDARRYRSYFPTVQVISPDAH